MPADASIPALREAATGCRGCELWADATQVVFSKGTASARIMLVGEQPGDREDRDGTPFVGPAGMLLAAAVDAAGIQRSDLYLTNAVKHFHFEERGKRRIHKTPQVAHVIACRPWLEAELDVVDPDVVVCLGATAGRAVFGRAVRIGAERGMPLDADGRQALLTTHPSAVLRLSGKPEYESAFEELVSDLRTAAEMVGARH